MKTRKASNNMISLKNDDGLVGTPDAIDIRSDGFQKLKLAIKERSAALRPEDKLKMELKAVKYRMQTYLQESVETQISVGYFLKEYLNATGIQLKSFASYLESNSGNVSKIINGQRKISPETAIILGRTFETEPELWLQIQDKNEILALKKISKRQFNRYSLRTLMESIHK